MELTKEQKLAIHTLNKNVVLNAGAGTGKTEVLTRRYVELIKSGVDLESIVCITFTKKAAKEMKERIRELLSSQEYDQEVNRLDRANISTIDSFCHKILLEYAAEANIDLKYQLNNDIKEESIFSIVSQLLKEEKYVSLVSVLGYQTFDQARDDLVDFILKSGDLFQADELASLTLQKIDAFDLKRWREALKEQVFELKEATEKNKRSKIAKYIHSPDSLEELSLPGPLSKEFIEGLKANESNISSSELKEINEELKELLSESVFILDQKNRSLYQIVFEFLSDVERSYQQEKKELGILDFQDLTKHCLKLLSDIGIRKEIQNRFQYIMVDEYQDSSGIQKAFFYSLASDKKILDRQNLFVVGDPKQSIYGFRGAKDSVFEETKKDIERSGGLSLTLTENFRSTALILEPINSIFSKLMDGRYQALRPMRANDDSNFYASPFDNKIKDDVEIDQMIHFIIDQLSSLNKELGDFTFLLRTSTSMGKIVEALTEKNIPNYVVNSRGFFKDPVIEDLLNYLHYLIYKDQISQVAVLKSSFFNLSDDELFKIYCQEDPENTLIFLEKESQELFSIFNESISLGILELLDRHPLDLYYASIDTNFQIQANLLKFLLLALRYDIAGKSILDFFHYCYNSRTDDSQMPVENENSPDVVKLMTIHQSKGLSMDSVLLPDLNKQGRSFSNQLIFHEELGLGIKWEEKGGLYQLIKNKKDQEDQKQLENLYYVAMTRAKNNLFLGVSGRRGGFISSKMAQDFLEEELVKGSIQGYSYEEDIVFSNASRDSIVEKVYSIDSTKYKKAVDYYNITMVSRFLLDPKTYYGFYQQSTELKMDDEKHTVLPKNQLGLFVHQFAEAYQGSFNSLFEDLSKDYPMTSEELKQARIYCQNFVHMNRHDLSNIQREVRFYLSYKDRLFTGIIDRVEKEEKQIKVIDFKISSMDDHIVEVYRTQLNFYCYVLAQIYPDYEIYGEIQNLQKEKVYKISYDKNRIEKELDLFIDFIENIE